MNYKEVAREISGADAERYVKGIRIMGDLADSLRRQGELPEKFSEIEVSPKTDELQPEREKGLQRQVKNFIRLLEHVSESRKLHPGLTQAEKEQIERHRQRIYSKKKLAG